MDAMWLNGVFDRFSHTLESLSNKQTCGGITVCSYFFSPIDVDVVPPIDRSIYYILTHKDQMKGLEATQWLKAFFFLYDMEHM